MFMCDEGSNCVDCNWKFSNNLSDITDEARTCPHLIEVAPVIHAHWIANPFNNFTKKCSYCGYISTDFGKYCSECGARMNKEV